MKIINHYVDDDADVKKIMSYIHQQSRVIDWEALSKTIEFHFDTRGTKETVFEFIKVVQHEWYKESK